MTTINYQALTLRQLGAMTVYAADLAFAYPSASVHALADKLLTVFQGTPRELREAVATTAIVALASVAA